MRKKIIRNAAQCRLCGDVIESQKLVDFQTCKCGEISVDGGYNFIACWASTNWNDIIDLSEYTEDE